MAILGAGRMTALAVESVEAAEFLAEQSADRPPLEMERVQQLCILGIETAGAFSALTCSRVSYHLMSESGGDLQPVRFDGLGLPPVFIPLAELAFRP
ncbi:MAG: hypothetical protein FJ035_01155 [Chloroflexi bacterium]|nr:hypothetical protein [Chloroflexota bacterium]